MKKNQYLFLIFSAIILLSVNCMSRYYILKETNDENKLSQYNTIHVGWLDLDESKWKDYGYESIDKWKVCINEMNVLGLQKHIKYFMPEKNITGDKSKSDKFPTKGDIYITLDMLKFEEGMKDELTVKLQFIEIKTKKKIYSGVITATQLGAHWSNLEATLDAIVYNIAQFIYDKS